MIFPNFIKHAGDMARSEPSDQIAINDRGEGVMWQREERPIARGFTTVDLHLSEEGVRGAIGFTRCILISTIDRNEL